MNQVCRWRRRNNGRIVCSPGGGSPSDSAQNKASELLGVLCSITTGSPQSAFIALLVMTGGSLLWLHVIVLRIKRNEATLPQPLPEEERGLIQLPLPASGRGPGG